jgi:hypothetical protein
MTSEGLVRVLQKHKFDQVALEAEEARLSGVCLRFVPALACQLPRVLATVCTAFARQVTLIRPVCRTQTQIETVRLHTALQELGADEWVLLTLGHVYNKDRCVPLCALFIYMMFHVSHQDCPKIVQSSSVSVIVMRDS